MSELDLFIGGIYLRNLSLHSKGKLKMPVSSLKPLARLKPLIGTHQTQWWKESELESWPFHQT